MPDLNQGWDRLPLEPPVGAPDQEQPPTTDLATSGAVEPWNQTGEIRLQEMNRAVEEVGQKVMTGRWDQETADKYLADLQPERQSLMARKQQSMVQAEQAQQQAVMKQAALAQSVQVANQQHAADNFLGTIRTFINPVTNQSADFFPDKAGSWAQVSLPDQPGEADMPVTETAGGGAPEVGPQPREDGPKKHTMTIEQGGKMQRFNYEDGKMVSSGPLTFTDGAPVPPHVAHEADLFGLTPDKMRYIDRTALASSMNIPDPRSRSANIAHVKQQLIMGAIRDSEMAQRQKNALELQTRHEQEAQRKEDVKAHAESQKEKGKMWDSTYQTKLGELQKEFDRIRDAKAAAPEGKQVATPDWATDRDTMEAEAEKRADRDYLRAHGHLPASRQQAAPKAVTPAEAPQPSKPPAVKPLPANKATLADVQAEIERRKRKAEMEKPLFNEQGQQQGQVFDGGFGAF